MAYRDTALSNIVPFKRPRNEGIKSGVRAALKECYTATGNKPAAVVMYVQSADGRYSLRAVWTDQAQPFDMYSRAMAIMTKARDDFMD